MKNTRTLRRQQGFTLIETMIVVAIIAIATLIVMNISGRRNGQSTAGATAAMDAAMENAQGIARSNNGATIEIKPDPINTNYFQEIIFAGVPQAIGSQLQQQSVTTIPMELTTAADSVFPNKWTTNRDGSINIFISSYGDTDFGQDWDPSTASTQLYPGCKTGSKLDFAMNSTETSKATPGDHGGVVLTCGQTKLVQYNQGQTSTTTPPPLSVPTLAPKYPDQTPSSV